MISLHLVLKRKKGSQEKKFYSRAEAKNEPKFNDDDAGDELKRF